MYGDNESSEGLSGDDFDDDDDVNHAGDDLSPISTFLSRDDLEKKMGLQEIEWVNSRVFRTYTSALSVANTLHRAGRRLVAG